MSRRPIVAMDVDDVLADFISTFMKYMAKYGVDPDLRPTSWEWDGLGLSGEELTRVRDLVWKDIIDSYEVHMQLSRMPGCSVTMMRELDKYTELYFPTARFECQGRSARVQTADWINWRCGVSYPTVIVSSAKGEMAKVLKYDYFIDDRPKNCIEVKEALPNCQVFLCDSTHNQSFHDPRFPRLKTADDFAQIVLSNGKPK